MKRTIAAILALLMLLPVLAIPASAASADTVEQTIKALGIMVGDEKGNMNLGQYVTRSQFAKMMTAASVYKDTIGQGARVSPFKDVKYTHWSAEYVKTAVDAGWIVGYTDGTFRPDNTIKLEEAASCLLKLLGYTAADLTGSYPAAQISKFRALGLGDDLNLSTGQMLTRRDCMYIFYNLMGVSTKDGKVYCSLLGYSLNAAGEIDYAGVMKATRKGPFVVGDAAAWQSAIPFGTDNITVYRDDTIGTLQSVALYDVWYYNESMKTVWAYSEKATGTYTSASPAGGYPDTVTVAGKSYKIATATAGMKLSSSGGFKIGDTITLLLGSDGAVVDVLDSASVSDIKYGVVVSSAKSSYTDADGKTITQNSIIVACTDGAEREYLVGNNTYDAGSVVSAGFQDGKVTVKWLAKSSISGRVDDAASAIGDTQFAAGVQILDANSSGGYLVISPSRLAGTSLNSENVQYYTLDSFGRITRLILNNITGDFESYGVLASSQKIDTGTSTSGSYRIIINGSETTASSSSQYYSVPAGPAMFSYKGTALSGIRGLTSTNITTLMEQSVMSGNKTFKLAENVQVYIKDSNSNYASATISSVSNTSKYQLIGWYDDFGRAAGGRIRVIIATEK